MKKVVGSVLVLSVLLGRPAFSGWVPADFDEAMRLGEDAMFFKEYDKAERYFRFACLKDSNKSLPHVRLGELYYEKSEYRRAKKEFETASGFGNISVVGEFLTEALRKINQQDKILGEIEKYQAGEGAHVDDLIRMHEEAAERMSEGKLYMSLTAPHWEFVLKYRPTDRRILSILAGGYYASSQPRKASVFYKKLSLLTPHDQALAQRTADVFAACRLWDQASLFYRRALREAVPSGGNVQELKKTIRAIPISGHRILRWIDDGEYDAALGALKKYLAFNSLDPWAVTLMGSVYLQKNNSRQAQQLFDRVLKNNPEYADIHYYAGFMNLKNNRYEDALKEFRIFRKLSREGAGRNENAVEKEQQKKEWNSATRRIAWVYSEYFNDPLTAAKELESLITMGVRDAEVYYDLGAAYLKAKKKASAYQAFKKVIELAPDSDAAKDAKDAIEYLRTHSDTFNEYASPYN